MSIARLDSRDTAVRVDRTSQGEIDLILHDMEGNAVKISGSISSVLMLADRINDRLHGYRGG